MAQQNLKDMNLAQVRDQARRAGVPGADQKKKDELIKAMSTSHPKSSRPSRSGGRDASAKPKGSDPSQWKNMPGNQS